MKVHSLGIRVVEEIEELRSGNDITDELTEEDWKIIDERIKRRHLASDAEVEALFDQYRRGMRVRRLLRVGLLAELAVAAHSITPGNVGDRSLVAAAAADVAAFFFADELAGRAMALGRSGRGGTRGGCGAC